MPELKCFLVIMCVPFLFSCEEQKPEIVQQVKKSDLPEPAWKPKFYGDSDVPANDSCITSAGMGKVMLGQKLDSLELFYDTIQSFNQNIDQLEWSAKKIILGKNEWIIVSTYNSIGRINMIRTNSKVLHTKNGYTVGMTISALRQDSLAIDQEERAFICYPEGIEFRIDPVYEKNFFRARKPNIRNLNPKAVIREIFLKCGDC